MYKITNIATNRIKGCLSHNHITGHAPSFDMPIEPWIAGFQLKLFETMSLPLEQFETHKPYIDKLVDARVVEIQYPNGIESKIETKKLVVEALEDFVEANNKFAELIAQAAQEVEQTEQEQKIEQIEEKTEEKIEEQKTEEIPEEEEIKVVVQQKQKPKKGKK